MGMYTEIYVNVTLQAEMPEQVRQLLTEGWKYEGGLPDHPFFKCERWGHILSPGLGGGSYYFNRNNGYCFTGPDDLSGTYSLLIIKDLKNYDSEIEKFFEWISLYVEGAHHEHTHVGHYRFEESEAPTVVMMSPRDNIYTSTIVMAEPS